jgi:hypothetical protein
MSLVLVFIHNWHESFRAQRHGNGFGILDSVRYGFAGAQLVPKVLP